MPGTAVETALAGDEPQAETLAKPPVGVSPPLEPTLPGKASATSESEKAQLKQFILDDRHFSLVR
jgi:hypothetical protein